MIIGWADAYLGHPQYFDISEENFEKLKRSKEDEKEVLYYCEYGRWPKSEEEQLEEDREFARNRLDLFLRVHYNQELFDEEERLELFRKARKKLLLDPEFRKMFSENKLKIQLDNAREMLMTDSEFRKMFTDEELNNLLDQR